MSPKVSLIVPCYNVEKYVRECLDSALAQTLRDIEIICVNDGSTDSTLSILEEFASEDARIKIIDKCNEGYGKSMNKGLMAATGDYIGILESDDFIEPETLEVLYTTAVEHEADVVKSNFYFYWSTPVKRDIHCNLIEEDECGFVFEPLQNEHIFHVKPSIWSAIYKKDFLDRAGIVFNETPGASYQDASFNFQVWLNASRVVLLRDAYLHYRQDNEASSVNSPGKVYCVCDEYEKMEEVLRNFKDSAKAKRIHQILVKMKYDTYMWNYRRLAPELRKEFVVRFSDDFRAHAQRGEIDRSLFKKDKLRDLGLIMEDPVFFDAINYEGPSSGKINTARRLFELGGCKYLFKLVSLKLAG